MARGFSGRAQKKKKSEPPSKSYGHFTHTHTHCGESPFARWFRFWGLFDFCLSYYTTGNCINTATAMPPAYKFNLKYMYKSKYMNVYIHIIFLYPNSTEAVLLSFIFFFFLQLLPSLTVQRIFTYLLLLKLN